MKRPRLRDELGNFVSRMPQQAIKNVSFARSLAEQMRQSHCIFPSRHSIAYHPEQQPMEILPRSHGTQARRGDHLGIKKAAQGLADEPFASSHHLDQPLQQRIT
jgi:hypothetical protein